MRKAREVLDQTKLQRRKMVHAAEAVKAAKEQAAEETSAQTTPKDASETPATDSSAVSATSEPIDWRQYIKPYPSSLDPVLAAQEGVTLGKRNPALRANAKDIKLVTAPIFDAEGISVKWANALDAEYAEMWPTGVQHENMGFVRNTAPVPDQEGAESVSDLKANMWKTRTANWDASIRPAEEQEQEQAVIEEGDVAESAQEQDREAVLSDIKDQILRDVKLKTGRPVWVWQREEKRLAKKGGNTQTLSSPSPTGGQAEVDMAAEPTSAENAPTL